MNQKSKTIDRCQISGAKDLKTILSLGYLPPVNKLKKINSNLSNIKFLSKNTLKGEYKLLSEKISKITNSLSKIDKDRLYQEIAILNERKDINEEIIRMSSHITLFQSCIKSKTNCGKKMN